MHGRFTRSLSHTARRHDGQCSLFTTHFSVSIFSITFTSTDADATRYALFSITDKVRKPSQSHPLKYSFLLTLISIHSCDCYNHVQSSAFLGPLVVGVIADTTGNIRYAFFFLAGVIWLSVPVLLSIDVERGRSDARMARAWARRYQA